MTRASRLFATTAAALGLSTLPTFAQTPSVVTDFAVTQSLVAQVMGDLGAPKAIVTAGDDPHHVQLRPSDARALAGADLVIWMGDSLSPWISEAAGESERLDLSALPGLHIQGFAPARLMNPEGHDDHAHDDHGHDDHGHDDHGHDDHGHDDHAHDEHGHDDHGHDDHGHDDHAHDDHGHAHDHGDIDPHLWLDPANAQVMVVAIAEALTRLDPVNAGTYAANAEAAAQAIAALDAELAERLAPARGTGLVVFHDAYGYFGAHYGLSILGAIAEGDATDPGAQRLATIRANLDAAGAECLFPEIGHSDRYLTLVAEGTDLRIGAPLDPEGRGAQPGAALYGTLLRALAEAIADCAAG